MKEDTVKIKVSFFLLVLFTFQIGYLDRLKYNNESKEVMIFSKEEVERNFEEKEVMVFTKKEVQKHRHQKKPFLFWKKLIANPLHYLKVVSLVLRMSREYQTSLQSKKKRAKNQKEAIWFLAECYVKAVEDLKENEVKSKRSKKNLANQVWKEFGLLTFRIMFIEHIGPFRSSEHLQYLRNRILAKIGRKKEEALKNARSEVGALGPFQFMKGTYKFIVSEYPKADLIRNFQRGASNYVNAIKAQLCFFDWVLSEASIDSREELVAAYNGGITRIIRLKREYRKNWRRNLPLQTSFYLKKWRHIRSL